MSVNPDDFLADAIRSTNNEPPLDDYPVGEPPPELIGGDWRDMLHTSGKRGDPKPVLINADIALRYSPEWDGVLAFDAFKQKIRVVKPPPIGGDCPRDWSDEDDTKAAVWMQSNGIYVGRDMVSAAVHSIAAEHSVHAVRDFLTEIVWDEKPRVETWLVDYLGVEKNEYSMSVGRMWLISAVARIMQPGCKADYMLVLEGDQGVKKSSALEELCGQQWFCDHQPDLHNKDAQMQLFGSWIIEWAELDALSRADITAVKSFITRRVEKLRPPYGRYIVEVPRQCVFAASTNERDWLKDATGGRRFWPVECTKVDKPALIRDRSQLWAEAKYMYDSGMLWWPESKSTTDRLEAEQSERMATDPWHEKIQAFVDTYDRITTNLIFSNCLEFDMKQRTQLEKNRIGRVMKVLGWKLGRWRENGILVRGYERPGSVQGVLGEEPDA